MFGFASYLLVAGGPYSAYSPTTLDDPLYRVPLGKPIADPQAVDGAYMRTYEQGAVAVNPGASPVTVDLGSFGTVASGTGPGGRRDRRPYVPVGQATHLYTPNAARATERFCAGHTSFSRGLIRQVATDQQNQAAAAASDDWMIEVDGKLVPDYDRTLTDFNEGDVVTGTVVRVDKDEILVDIGYKSEGVIPLAELTIRRSVNPDDEVAVGEAIDALVLQKEDADGRLILSKKRARFEKAWRRIEAAAESGEPVEGAVIEVVKGGLIIDLGVRGFLPASLVDIRRVQDLDEYRDQTLRCKVIELNRSRNNVVLSRRAVLEEERREQRQQILDRLQPGVEVEGVISNIVDFGAFVDLDGIDGLIHISELSWSHVNHPSEVLEIGQTVRVKVLDVDRDRQRISLGLKQTQTDPWQRVIDETQQDDVVIGRITKVVTFGAFAEILPGVEGLIHISELADHHVENPREVVQQGEEHPVKVIEIDPERRRLSLSIKRVEEGETARRLQLEDGTTVAAPVEEPVPDLGLSEEVFAQADAEAAAEPVVEEPVEQAVAEKPVADEPVAEEPAVEEPAAEEEPAAPAEDAPAGRAGRGACGRRDRVRRRRQRALASGGVMTPVVVGLTGGIGSGKSEALAAFRRRGAATLSSDDVVRALYERPQIVEAVAEHFGSSVLSRRPARSTGRRSRGWCSATRPSGAGWSRCCCR